MKKYKLEKVINVYSLEEMLRDPEKKKNLLEKNQLGDQMIQVFMDDAVNELEGELEEMGFKNASIRYDVSCCQGSGSSFTFDNVDVFKLKDTIEEKQNRLLKDLEENIIENALYDGFADTVVYLDSKGDMPIIKGKSNSLSNHYCHSNTVDIDIEHLDEIPEHDEAALIVNELIDTDDWTYYENNLTAAVKTIYKELCSSIHKELSDQYEGCFLEDTIINDLKSNDDDEFTADGKCFRPDIYDYPDYTITEVEDTEDYVILDQDGKIWCSIEIPGNPAGGKFLDISDLPNMGKARAIIMKRKEAEQIRQNLANNKIRSLETTELMLASEAFKEEKEK